VKYCTPDHLILTSSRIGNSRGTTMVWRMRALKIDPDSLDAISRSSHAQIPTSLRLLPHITTPLLFLHNSFSSSFLLFTLPGTFYLQRSFTILLLSFLIFVISIYIVTMPPKKDAAAGESTALLVGFTDKETKLLAAAFVSCTAPDKVCYLRSNSISEYPRMPGARVEDQCAHTALTWHQSPSYTRHTVR
jgi:hypothetical protein